MKVWHVVAAAVAAVAVAAALTLATRSRGPGRGPGALEVRVAYVGSIVTGPPRLTGTSALVLRDGWLESELARRNAVLRWVPMPNANVGPMTNEAFANGSIDFAGYGDLPSIIANAAGIHTKLVVPNGRGGDTYLVVPPDSTAKSILDLKGKRVAVHRGRPWELPFARLVDSVGLTYADFSVVNLDPEARAAALAAHKIDALCTLNSAYLLEEKGVGRILWSTASSPPDWKMLGGLWVSSEFAQHQPEVTQLVATAYVRANAWAAREDSRDAMIELASLNGTPKSAIRREYERGSWRDRWSPLIDAPVFEHYRRAIEYAAEKHIIDHAFDFRASADDRHVRRALQDLNLEGYWSERQGL